MQRLGVAHRAPARGGLAREEQGARRPRPVLGRRGVGARPPPGSPQQVGRAPVVQAAHGRGRAGMEHLVHEVVRELVAAPVGTSRRAWRPARSGGRSPAPGAPAGPRPPRGRPSPRGRRRPAAAPRPAARGAGRARAPRPGGSRARPTSPESSPRRVSTTNSGCPRGAPVDRRGQVATPDPARRARRPRRVERAEVEALGDVVEVRQAVGALLGAHRRAHEEPGAARGAGRGSAAARRWPGRRCAGRRARAAAGAVAVTATSRAASAANTRRRSGGPIDGAPSGARSGKRAASTCARGPSTGAAAAGSAASTGPSASTRGWRNSERSAAWQRADATRPPVAAASSVTSAASRVLPIPASPASSTSPDRPRVAASQRRVSRAISSVRPDAVARARRDRPGARVRPGPVPWSRRSAR